MAHQVIDMKCPGCGAPTSTGETTCKYCHRPVIISTFNSVYSMPLPEVNKYAGAYRKALSENPDSMELNNSVAMCYLKLKLYDKATEAFERAMEDPCPRRWIRFLRRALIIVTPTSGGLILILWMIKARYLI